MEYLHERCSYMDKVRIDIYSLWMDVIGRCMYMVEIKNILNWRQKLASFLKDLTVHWEGFKFLVWSSSEICLTKKSPKARILGWPHIQKHRIYRITRNTFTKIMYDYRGKTLSHRTSLPVVSCIPHRVEQRGVSTVFHSLYY